MAWTTPKTWSVSEVLTAANMNTYLRDNTDWIGTSHPHCRVYNSANISITTSGTAQAVTFDSERYDVANMHSTSSNTSRITVPTGGGGVYIVGGALSWTANATGVRQTRLQTNGTTIYLIAESATTTATSAMPLPVATAIAMVAGDYVELIALQTSGGALNTLASSNYAPEFWAHWQST